LIKKSLFIDFQANLAISLAFGHKPEIRRGIPGEKYRFWAFGPFYALFIDFRPDLSLFIKTKGF